jgi:aquaporin Z
MATFILIFIGAGAIMTSTATGGATGLTGIALAHGLAIFIGVAAMGHVSGAHINPAVTIGFLITRRIPVLNGGVYIVAQLVGAIIGALVLRAAFTSEIVAASSLGTPALGPGVTMMAGILLEAILTFILVTVIFQTAGHPQGPKVIAPLAIGFTITLDILMGGPLTGAAMNPARAFGPALVGGYWANHIVYWIGPIAGGALAALVAHHILQRDET